MAGTTKPHLQRDFLNGEFGFSDQQVLRSCHTLSHHVGMGRHARGLAEGALEMAGAYACKFGKSE